MGGETGRARRTRVPAGRSQRAGRMAALFAGIAGETALEVLRRVSGAGKGSVVATPGNVQRLADALAELRGAALKLGQLVSLQGEDLLPPELAEILATLRDHADFMPRAQVQRVLHRELGRDWRGRFIEFDDEPLAAASIGQVHAATARDGRDLALKLQYPGVERSIDADVDNIVLLLRALRLLPPGIELNELMVELKRELHREADYRREADNTERYAELLGSDPDVFAPRVHRDLSTRRLLATDRVRALPIDELRSPQYTRELRDRMGSKLLHLVFRELFSFRFVQTDPNFANYLYDPKDERIALLDFGAARRVSRRVSDGYRGIVLAAARERLSDLFSQARHIGLLSGSEPAAALDAFARLCLAVAEPLRSKGPYDFGGSDLPSRVRQLSAAAYGETGMAPMPAPLLLLHRKLAGSYLLLQHLGASVELEPILQELL